MGKQNSNKTLLHSYLFLISCDVKWVRMRGVACCFIHMLWNVCGCLCVCVCVIWSRKQIVQLGVVCCVCTRYCVAVCCSVLQQFPVCCSVLQCVAVCCSVLQCVAVCCSVLQCNRWSDIGLNAIECCLLQCVLQGVLQCCVAVCFIVLQ